MLLCAKSSQKRWNGLQVPWNASVSLTLGNTIISIHEANVDWSKKSIHESQAENKAFGCMRGWAQQLVTQQEILPWEIVIIFTCEERDKWISFSNLFLTKHTNQKCIYLHHFKRNPVGLWQHGSYFIDLLSPNVSHTYLLAIFMFIKCVPKPFRIKSTIVPRAPAKGSQWEGLSLLFPRI